MFSMTLEMAFDVGSLLGRDDLGATLVNWTRLSPLVGSY